MVNEIIILFDGYSYMSTTKENVMKANCTCTLIKGTNKNVIIDTLTCWDSEKLINELRKYNITTDSIDCVVSTHSHSDHIGNNNLFLKGTHIVGQSISFKDEYYLHDFKNSYKIDENIVVTKTPGHTMDSVSIIIQNGKCREMNGTFAITGDLFENSDDITDESIWLDAVSEDPDLQRKHRFEISNLADFIIPGHGKMFKVSDEIRETLKNDLNKIR